MIQPPQGTRGQPRGALNNIFSKVMEENTGEGTTRKLDYNVNLFHFQNNNLDTTEDKHILNMGIS